MTTLGLLISGACFAVALLWIVFTCWANGVD